MAPITAIEVQGLEKKYSDVHAVKGIDFVIRTGEIFSLLGPNGAGKSTTISLLCCLIKPTRGDAAILGNSVITKPMEVKRVIGVVPQEIALYPDLTACENLQFWGKLYGLFGQRLRSRIEKVLEVVGLSERRKQTVRHYSGGMKRRLNIAIALLHDPQIIIMDEPTVGIDPQSRRHILENVKKMNGEGKTILYTTHYMEEAQEISSRIAIMDRGEIIAVGTHTELVRFVGEQNRIDFVVAGHPEKVEAEWKKVNEVGAVVRQENTITVLTENSNAVLPTLFTAANRLESHISSVNIMEPNLESVFLQLTGHSLRD